jgi:arabinofuranosyltransferase
VSRAAFAIACSAAAAFVLSRAWIADDAFITWRVIENLVAGHGLRWNTGERVQVFTHPLWALLQVPLYAVSGSLAFSSFALSAVCLLLAGALAWRAVEARRAAFLFAFVAPLVASRAFSDHAVSGMESPLVAACLAAFAAQALPARAARDPLRLSLAASLAATTRLDALLLALPCLAVLALRDPRGVRLGRLAAGLLPLVAWELFALLYYGSPFPNTKYAKLDTGIPAAALATQGLRYALDLLRRDAGSAWLLLVALALAARRLPAALRGAGDPEAPAFAALGAGIAAYLLYLIAIGGDFMSGRLFAPAVFLAAVLVARALRDAPRPAAGVAAVAALASLAGVAARPVDPNATWHGIADERRVFEGTTSVLRRPGFRDGAPARHPWSVDGGRARELARERGEPVVIVRGAVGMLGVAAGPDVTVIDRFALGDALLARLPVEDPRRWRIGHFGRALPEGYLHARETGDASRMQPELRRYFEALRLVVSGPLLAPERLLAIARLNAGAYDGLLDSYLRSQLRDFQGRSRP